MTLPRSHGGTVAPTRESDLLALLRECAKCRCDFRCYCDDNANWAERELDKLRRGK